MESNIIFIAITFVVYIVVFLMVKGHTSASYLFPVIAILTYFFTLTNEMVSFKKNLMGEDKGSDEKPIDVVNKTPEKEEVKEKESMSAAEDEYLYGDEQGIYNSYKYIDNYKKPQLHIKDSCTEATNSIDSQLALMGQKRTRDKKTADSVLVKDTNFFKHHYSKELEEEENKPWWGRYEM